MGESVTDRNASAAPENYPISIHITKEKASDPDSGPLPMRLSYTMGLVPDG